MLFSWIADSHVLFIFRKYNTKNPLLSFVCPAIARHLPGLSIFVGLHPPRYGQPASMFRHTRDN